MLRRQPIPEFRKLCLSTAGIRNPKDMLERVLQRCFADASTLGILLGDLNLTPAEVEDTKAGLCGNVQDVMHHPKEDWQRSYTSEAEHATDYIIAGDAKVDPIELPGGPILGLDKSHDAILARVVYRASTPVPARYRTCQISQQDIAVATRFTTTQTLWPAALSVPQDAGMARLAVQQEMDRQIFQVWWTRHWQQSSASTPAPPGLQHFQQQHVAPRWVAPRWEQQPLEQQHRQQQQ